MGSFWRAALRLDQERFEYTAHRRSPVAMTVRAAAVPVGVLATGVAYSRVHTGVHYPGDVAAGVLLGATVGLLLGRRARRSGLPPCRRQGQAAAPVRRSSTP